MNVVLDLVLPVYNEAHVLDGSVARLIDRLSGMTLPRWRIVIAENGSSDSTAQVAAQLAEQDPRIDWFQIGQPGRGRALRKAWQRSDAEMSFYMDIDLSTDLAVLPRAIAALEAGADLVCGDRLDRESKTQRSFKRDFLSRHYNRLIRWMLHTRAFDDAQCGFKGVCLESIRPLLPLIEDNEWFFDTELLVLAEYAGLSIESLPIKWTEDADSRVNIPATIWQDIRGLVRLRREARRKIAEMQHSDR